MINFNWERLKDLGCIALWIFMSSTMLFYNKFLLSFYGFNFPISLTLWHMVVCSSLAWAAMRAGWAKPLDISGDTYRSKILPIAGCYAAALWSGNAGYAVSTVSFAQMVKSATPVMTYFVGMAWGVESYTHLLLLDVAVITCGVGVAAYGESELVLIGFALLVLCMAFEATRLVLSQQLMQATEVRFTPITTLYYVAPPAAAALLLPYLLLEARASAAFVASTPRCALHLIANALIAFGLNLSVYLLIGRTSALTMNVSGLVKDWFTISGSVLLLGSVVTVTQLFGYAVAFAGVCWYNYLRIPRAAGGGGGGGGSAGGVTQPGGGAGYKVVPGADDGGSGGRGGGGGKVGGTGAGGGPALTMTVIASSIGGATGAGTGGSSGSAGGARQHPGQPGS
ncbi:hypothetical protein FOA52_004637 [Chlamydomonas sp. UWO 241]|nr:hypothetical protein FOA52_004637 [Chlamydomonas sp. UWO 241]